MFKIRYIGVHDEVVVPDIGDEVIKRGDAVEVDEELGRSLLKQETNWEEVKHFARPENVRPEKDGE